MEETINYLKNEIRYLEYQRSRKVNIELEHTIEKLRLMLKLAYEIELITI